MNSDELKNRTKQFALRVMKLVDALPRTASGRAIGNQLIRSGTSVGANYRSACRARSTAEFVARIGIVEEEADESGYWMELICDGRLVRTNRVQSLIVEAGELVAIASASRKTAAKHLRRTKSEIGNRKSEIR